MSFPMANLENYVIPLDEIKTATEEFRYKKEIAEGEYSTIYRGKLSESWGNRTAAFKRFIKDRCDGKKEFLNELKFISNLNHENVISFLGYCDEGEEMIIVYEYPVDGHSLLTYLDWRSLTWQQRLEICLDAARGLDYLHSGLGQHETVIHGSIMENNILLDENMKAKICGFEISELIPGNDQPCNKQVYKPYTNKDMNMRRHKDPIYLETGFLKAESDIYSFGVLLFTILTSTQTFEAVIKDGECIQTSLTMMIQHHYHNRLDWLINPAINDQIGGPSLRMIEEITCKCLSYNIKDRPTMDMLIKTIKDALDIHNRDAISVKGSSGEYRNPKQFIIPHKELKMRRFKKSSLPPHVYSDLYTAELFERWPNRTVVLKEYDTKISWQKSHNECEIVSRFHHKNIIPFLGYCVQGVKKVLIYDDAINGSLRDHLQDQDKLRCIPWEQRLKICLGAARGLKYLHSGLWDENRIVVHRHIRSEYILLDENMEAKISAFGLSLLLQKNKPQVADDHKKWELGDSAIIRGYKASMDPIYKESCIVNTEVDVYSFGVVMFEILSGLNAYEQKHFDDDDDANNGDEYSEKNNVINLIQVPQRTHFYTEKLDLIRQVHRRYGENEMDKLIDPNIRDQIDGRSVQTFAETAYKCLSYNIKERPSMNRIVKKIEEALYFQKNRTTDSTTTIQSQQYQKLENLLIPLKEIKLATCGFSKTSEIGKGGFGVVYKGRLSERWTKHEAAFKRLDKTSDKEKTGFLKELKLISMFNHQNIIRLIGYCEDGDEMILVSEYAINGSLDDHLEDPKKKRLLTWNKRLNICLGAAKGLDYLHSGLGEDNKVIHRDVKSGNILLDDNLEAKICDFGLSKSGLTYDHQHSKHYTGVAGTNYYMDPIYHESGILRTESDVYSFGVVMFEMLSGMPAYYRRKIGDDKPRLLINLVRRYYDYGKDLLIDPQIKAQIDKNSFHTFIDIAYQCISFSSKERPTMETIADKIEEALDFQVKKDVSCNGD